MARSQDSRTGMITSLVRIGIALAIIAAAYFGHGNGGCPTGEHAVMTASASSYHNASYTCVSN